MKLLKRKPTKNNRVVTTTVTRLPIMPVFEQGLIVFARSFDDGMRVVTFEEPFVSPQSTQLYLGKGESVDAALAQALHFFHNDGEEQTKFQVQVQDRGPAHVRKLNSRLDLWLAEHDGVMHAVSEDDGDVLVRLEGKVEPNNPASRYVTLEGAGNSYYGALATALNQYSKYAPNAVSIAVTSA